MTRMMMLFLKGRIENYKEKIVFNFLNDSPEIEGWITLTSYNLLS